MLSGGVRASKAKVLTHSSTISPKISPKSSAPDYKTKIKKDKTTLVEVYEGVVDVTAEGKTVTLKKGFGTEVKFKHPPSLPRALPPSPELASKRTPRTTGLPIKSASKNLSIDLSKIS